MSFTEKFERTFRRYLPTPFTIALILTVIAFLFALVATWPAELGLFEYSTDLALYWQQGLWNAPLMVFAMQMMLMLVLGHTLALSAPVNHLINKITGRIKSNTSAVFWVTLLTLIVALFNWGLGLIFGAIFARKIGEISVRDGFRINYPLIGAAGYSGLMVWHGGISGSAPLKANESGHIRELVSGTMSESQLGTLPDLVPAEDTLFSTMNISVSLALLVALPLFMVFLARKSKTAKVVLPSQFHEVDVKEKPIGAERIDLSAVTGRFVGVLIITLALYLAVWGNDSRGLSFLTPNWINFVLLGMSLLFHKNIRAFLNAVDHAIAGAAGILIQFPLYFGIMGLMKDSGLVQLMAEWLTSNASAASFPFFTFVSSGIINIFVPSGGGQWAVQAPILIKSSTELGIPLSKSIMSLAYGDQLTNMLQPFWALPLLGITGLKAREILPYTLLLMLVGAVIFIIGLYIF